MYILGIDPGIRKLGYAIIDKNLNIIQAGILIDEYSNIRETQFERLKNISNFFDNLFKKYNIKYCGIEKLYFTTYNKNNAEFIYGVRGILIEKIIKKNIILFEFSPKEIKKNITGNGKANKKYIQQVISKIYSLKYTPKFHDCADALAICYLIFKKLNLGTN